LTSGALASGIEPSAEMPPMAPRFIDSKAEDGTTMTVDRPLRIVS